MTNERETEADPVQGGRNDRLLTQALLPTAVSQIAELIAEMQQDRAYLSREMLLAKNHNRPAEYDWRRSCLERFDDRMLRLKAIADAINASQA